VYIVTEKYFGVSLHQLSPQNGELGDLYIPTKMWLESCSQNIRTGMVLFMGTLSIIEHAQLGNWFEVHIAKNKDLHWHCQWLGLLPLAHTCTLWLVSLLHKNRSKLQKIDIDDDNQVLEAAWRLQTTQTPKVVWNRSQINVDKECLERLEEEMFERSALAGIAGNYQWGLDAGDHQEGWNPFAGTPLAEPSGKWAFPYSALFHLLTFYCLCKGNPFRFRCPLVFRFRFRLPPAFRFRSRHLVPLSQRLRTNDVLRHPLPTRFRSRSHGVA